jgi:hypothetical protein
VNLDAITYNLLILKVLNLTMAETSLPPIASLFTADEGTIKSVLDTLFEPSPEIHAVALPVIQQRRRIPANPGISADLPAPPSNTVPDDLPFTSYASLIQHIGALLHQLTVASSLSTPARERLHRILGSHPRLGAKKVDSAQSRAEQAQLHTNIDPTEAQQLEVLNREYEERFPGLRYVVFVDGRSRDVIMGDMRRRIDRGDVRAEEREGIQVSFTPSCVSV